MLGRIAARRYYVPIAVYENAEIAPGMSGIVLLLLIVPILSHPFLIVLFTSSVVARTSECSPVRSSSHAGETVALSVGRARGT